MSNILSYLILYFYPWILSKDVVLAIQYTVLSLLSEMSHLIGRHSTVQLRAWACLHYSLFLASNLQIYKFNLQVAFLLYF